MPNFDFDENPQTVEFGNDAQEVHFNFVRPFVKFNKTPGLYNFDDAAQEVHFDVEGSIGISVDPGDCNSCFPDGGVQDDVLVKQSAVDGDATWTNVLDSGGF